LHTVSKNQIVISFCLYFIFSSSNFCLPHRVPILSRVICLTTSTKYWNSVRVDIDEQFHSSKYSQFPTFFSLWLKFLVLCFDLTVKQQLLITLVHHAHVHCNAEKSCSKKLLWLHNFTLFHCFAQCLICNVNDWWWCLKINSILHFMLHLPWAPDDCSEWHWAAAIYINQWCSWCLAEIRAKYHWLNVSISLMSRWETYYFLPSHWLEFCGTCGSHIF